MDPHQRSPTPGPDQWGTKERWDAGTGLRDPVFTEITQPAFRAIRPGLLQQPPLPTPSHGIYLPSAQSELRNVSTTCAVPDCPCHATTVSLPMNATFAVFGSGITPSSAWSKQAATEQPQSQGTGTLSSLPYLSDAASPNTSDMQEMPLLDAPSWASDPVSVALHPKSETYDYQPFNSYTFLDPRDPAMVPAANPTAATLSAAHTPFRTVTTDTVANDVAGQFIGSGEQGSSLKPEAAAITSAEYTNGPRESSKGQDVIRNLQGSESNSIHQEPAPNPLKAAEHVHKDQSSHRQPAGSAILAQPTNSRARQAALNYRLAKKAARARDQGAEEWLEWAKAHLRTVIQDSFERPVGRAPTATAVPDVGSSIQDVKSNGSSIPKPESWKEYPTRSVSDLVRQHGAQNDREPVRSSMFKSAQRSETQYERGIVVRPRRVESENNLRNDLLPDRRDLDSKRDPGNIVPLVQQAPTSTPTTGATKEAHSHSPAVVSNTSNFQSGAISKVHLLQPARTANAVAVPESAPTTQVFEPESLGEVDMTEYVLVAGNTEASSSSSPEEEDAEDAEEDYVLA